jgi:hypothetical protein
VASYIPAPNTFELDINGSFLGHTWHWILNVLDAAGGGLTQAVANTLASGVSTDINTRIGAFSTAWSATACQVTDLSTQNGASYAGTFTTRTGTDAGQPLPPQTALVVSWRTNNRGSAFRGRTYLNGFTESVNVSGRGPDVASLASYQNLANDWLTRFGVTVNYPLSVVSRYHGIDPDGKPIPRVTALTTRIVSGTVKDAWRTQRRRAKQVI